MRGRSQLLAVFAGLFNAVIAVSPVHADIIVGTPGPDANCFPFGCAFNWGPEYQQVYNAKLFPGSITIVGLTFYRTFDTTDGGTLDLGTFTLHLSTTTAAVGALSPNEASNIGSNNTTVFSGPLPPLDTSGRSFTINFSAPFEYDPADGNLLLDVFSSDATQPGCIPGGSACTYLDSDTSSDDTSRMANGFAGPGLITGFEVATGIPEPASLTVVCAGIFGLVGARRRRERNR